MSSTKTKTRSWLSILTHDIPSPLPPTVENHPAPCQETPSVIKPSSPVDSRDDREASPAPIPRININAAAPCKPVGRLARRPIGDDSYYRSDADLERDRAQRQAYRDWVAMNEMAKREMTQSQEAARESSQPAISLKKVDQPVGEQLKTPLYLKPGRLTATTLFYRQDRGAVELEGEDYDIYMNSKRKWERNEQARACSVYGEKRDLGVVLEMYECLLEHLVLLNGCRCSERRQWLMKQRASQLTIHIDCDHNHIKDNIFVNERALLRRCMTPVVETRKHHLHCVIRRTRGVLLLTEQKTRKAERIFG